MRPSTLKAERVAASSGHIRELQSLRGIAAMAVVFGHTSGYYEVPRWFVSLSQVCNGRAAVVIFFVLSGYVLTRSLRNTIFNGGAVTEFYIRRLFRIYPAIWAASALGLFYLSALHWQIPVDNIAAHMSNVFRADRFDLLHIVASFAGMLAFILPPLWSIFVELMASVAMPAIAFLAFYRRQWLLALLCLSILLSFTLGLHSYYHLCLYFMDFVAGAGLAVPGLAERLFRNAPSKLVFIGGLLLLAATRFMSAEYWSPGVHVIETTGACLIIGVLVGAKSRIAVLKSNLLLFVGDTSYSIYLLHYPVLCILAKLFAVIRWHGYLQWGVIPMTFLLIVATCTVTIPLAWLSFRYVENPGNLLGKKVVAGLHNSLGAVPE